MRLIRLEFENLASLVGHWEIDFSHEAYRDGGVFAIIGPTGAGKTTLFDAICLALFGRTPRLEKFGKDRDEILSRAADECMACVTFRVRDTEFYAKWEHRRTRKKGAAEPFSPVTREFGEVRTGKVLASKLKDVEREIQSVLGMDFDQFCRSVLLAQGDFSRFLKSSVKERKDILEKIASTDRYFKVVDLIRETEKAQRQTLRELQDRLGALELLDQAQKAEMDARIRDSEARLETDLLPEIAGLEDTLRWHTDGRTLETLRNSLTTRESVLTADREAFRDAAEMLRRGEEAEKMRLAASLRELALRELEQKLADLEAARSEALTHDADLAATRAKLEPAQRAHTDAEQAHNVLAAQLPEVRRLDFLLGTLRTDQTGAEARRSRTCRDMKGGERALETARALALTAKNTLETRMGECDAARAAVDTWVEKIGALAEAQEALTLRKTAVAKLRAALEDRRTLDSERDTITADRDAKDRRKQKLETRITAASQNVADCEARLSLHEKRLRDQCVLQLRDGLQAGDTCPVCGARVPAELPTCDHPDPQADSDPHSDTAATREQLHAELQTARDTLRKLEDSRLALAASLESAELDRLAERESAWAARLTEALAALELPQGLEPGELESALLGIESEIAQSLAQARTFQNELAHAQRSLKSLQEQVVECTRQGRETQTAVDRQETALQNLSDLLETLDTEIAERAENLRDRAAERAELFGDRDTQREESASSEKLRRTANALQEIRTQIARQETSLDAARRSVESLTAQLAALGQSAQEREREFADRLAASPFPDEAAFRAALLDETRLTALRDRQKTLADRELQLKTESENCARMREEHERRPRSALPEEDVQTRLAELRAEQKALTDTVAVLRNELRQNAEREARAAGLAGELERQRVCSRRWSELYTVVGTVEGGKTDSFTSFAQDWTFAELLEYANDQLERLCPRYSLATGAEPLMLFIRDAEQGGEMRSADNLSGGESFLVSLALALGLTRMNSQKIEIGSLFLDEGFGTLDEASLENALDALARFGDCERAAGRDGGGEGVSGDDPGGKLIGIISHVEALKERIDTKIEVTRFGNGSRLSGPGINGHLGPSRLF